MKWDRTVLANRRKIKGKSISPVELTTAAYCVDFFILNILKLIGN